MSSHDNPSSQQSADNDTTTANHRPSPGDLWEIFFPFESVYDAQADGIEEITSLIDSHGSGYAVLEGACGTGKTLLALISGLAVARSPQTSFQRLFVTTSVKQQLEAFEDDLDTLNNHLESLNMDNYDVPERCLQPITALTLVGKRDVCPYTFSGHIDADEIYGECAQLQDTTRAMVSHYDDDQLQAQAAGRLVEDAERTGEQSGETREIDAEETHPYPSQPPTNQNAQANYCPYYAQSLLDDITDNDPIPLEGSILTPDRLANYALQQGACPHESMKEAAPEAEVLLGNYAHILQPQTLQAFTRHLIGDDTFLICDEAHTLPAKAKSTFSQSSTLTDISKAISEIEQVETWLTEAPPTVIEDVSQALTQASLSPSDITRFRELLEFTLNTAKQAIQGCIPDSDTSIRKLQQLGSNLNRPEHIPLREPTEKEVDSISAQYNTTPHATQEPETARFGQQVGMAVADAYQAAADTLSSQPPKETIYTEQVGSFIQQYYLAGHQDYFREALAVPQSDYRVSSVEDNPDHSIDIPQPLLLRVKNCFPASDLERTLSKFGGGICMSATLTPQWAYKHEIGLDYIDAPTTTLSYGLNFPKENRRTLAVTLDKFTASNRTISDTAPSHEQQSAKQLRERYATAVKHVVRETPGNVLVAGPSYAEAEWIAEELQADTTVDKPVLLDTSSSNAETYALRDEFVAGQPKVLTSSMLGTITEGVDYDGDALKAIAVFGVPIENTRVPGKQAEQLAYDEHFKPEDGNSGQGFQLAHIVPAVRKARQALGRVIRSTSDVGTRVLIDARYTKPPYCTYLTEQERTEITTATHRSVQSHLETFWEDR